MLPWRYYRNHEAISETQQEALKDKRVLVVGCGGLGGYVVEYLGRLGVGHLVVVDGDVFDDSNLNRQILSSNLNLGKPKVLAAKQRMQAVNPLVEVTAIQGLLDESNALAFMEGCDVVVDALDGIPSRLILQASAAKAGIPMVHGAIAGWCGQVCIIQPGENRLEKIYGNTTTAKGMEETQGNLSFTAALVAGIQAAETVKLLLGIGRPLKGLLYIDLLNGECDEIPLG